MTAAHAAHPAEPSRELQQVAFNRAHTERWPATLDEALAIPHLRICINGIARNLQRADWAPGEQRTPRAAPVVPPLAPPAAAPAWPTKPRPHRDLFDARRAAANDRDED